MNWKVRIPGKGCVGGVGRVAMDAGRRGRCDGVFIGGCFPGLVHTLGAAIRDESRAFCSGGDGHAGA